MEERVGPEFTNQRDPLNAYGYWVISHSFFAVDVDDGCRSANVIAPIDASDEIERLRAALTFPMPFVDEWVGFRVDEQSYLASVDHGQPAASIESFAGRFMTVVHLHRVHTVDG